MSAEPKPLVLTHDPDSGCPNCPFSDMFGIDDYWCNLLERSACDPTVSLPAPNDCPLRTRTVEVKRG